MQSTASAMTGAERVQRHRERKARGVLCVVHAEITSKTVRALLQSRYLDPRSDLRWARNEIEEAVNEALKDWVDGRHG